MEEYMKENKAAWEEAFSHKKEGWGDDNYKRILNEELPFFDPAVVQELKRMDFQGKSGKRAGFFPKAAFASPKK
jgi:hypothetical protein